MEPSKDALDLIGQEITIETNGVEREGVCDRAERVAGVMITEDGQFPLVRFRIKPAEGRAFWTNTFADRGCDRDASKPSRT